MNASDFRVVRRADTKSFLEEDEHCRLYVSTGKVTFGTSNLLPGKTGAVDKGHKTGEEVFFVVRGRVLCHFPNKSVYKELFEGDAIVIPPGEPHQLINTGTEEAVVSWSLAPPDS